MNVHRLADSAIVWAPAKLNLFFEVLAQRGDGYHEVETLMVAIGLYDRLVARASSDGAITVECRWAAHGAAHDARGPLPTARANLATKAVELLRARAGTPAGISLEIEKRIPTESGMGGASSDAAAALLAANAVWKLNWSRAALAELAGELGSDVSFFLGPPAAICRGRGERVEPLGRGVPMHFVVVRPPVGLATAEVYKRCEVPREPRGVRPLVAALEAGDERRLRAALFNRLEHAAGSISPWVERLARAFADEDFVAAQMSGSGSSYFGVCRHARHARRLAGRLQAQGMGEVYLASTCN